PKLAARLGQSPQNGRESSDSDVRVADALGKIGPPAQRAVPALLRMLDRAHTTQRPDDFWSIWPHYRAAIGALGQIGNGSPPVVAALRLQLANKISAVRLAAT